MFLYNHPKYNPKTKKQRKTMNCVKVINSVALSFLNNNP